MKEELINKLYNEFEKDKETIKKNLLLATDTISLDIGDNDLKVELTIEVIDKFKKQYLPLLNEQTWEEILDNNSPQFMAQYIEKINHTYNLVIRELNKYKMEETKNE